jgi:hypothetical protein
MYMPLSGETGMARPRTQEASPRILLSHFFKLPVRKERETDVMRNKKRNNWKIDQNAHRQLSGKRTSFQGKHKQE